MVYPKFLSTIAIDLLKNLEKKKRKTMSSSKEREKDWILLETGVQGELERMREIYGTGC